jgi:flagellar hook protein FlgE
MGLTTAMYTSLSGMVTNSQAIQVAGDNIANVNTPGFKGSRADFQTQISQLLRSASGPTANGGGSNPTQLGLGVGFGAVTKNFSNGSVQATGVDTELAIEGAGFFVLNLNGSQRYTRAGNFQLDRDFNLVNSGGGRVQGFGVDANFNVVGGSLIDLNIPLGTSTLAEATKTVQFAGNLNAGGAIATQGTIIASGPMFSDAGATTPATATDLLTTLFNGAGTSLFATGDIITIQNVQVGDGAIPTHTFEVGPAVTGTADAAGTTLQDFMTFLQQILGIDPSVSGGVTVSAGGALTVEGNRGLANNIELDSADIIVNAGGATPTAPFALGETQAANGESIRTTFFGFDSIGNEIRIDMSVVLESKNNTGTTWRFYASSEDDSDLNRVLGTGTLQFDTNGQLLTTTGANVQIDRAGTGAFTPQQIRLSFAQGDSGVTSLADDSSQLAAVSQDGSAIGTLEGFSVGADGTITGVYSNGLLRTQGRVALAKFSNPTGLQSTGGNLFVGTPNSGIAAIVNPGDGGSGRIIGGALELSNVELSQEFINLITASTGFSASSRVLTTSEQMIQELLSVIR